MPDFVVPQKQIKPQVGFQQDFLSSHADITIGGGAAGLGKRLHVDTLIPTPNGFIRNGDLKAGDIVYNDNGEEIQVYIAHPIIQSSGWKFIFDDGSSVISCDDHLWQTYTASDLERITRGYEAKKTIKTSLDIALTLKRGERLNHAIHVCKPIVCDEKKLPIDPYILGLWLGDGGERDCCITTADEEVLESFSKAGFEPKKWKDKYTYGLENFTNILSSNGLKNNKHIPAIYLRASIQQRISLLQGLFDSDGCSTGTNEFCSVNKHLAEGVAQLLRSLGIKCNFRSNDSYLNGSYCGQRYRITCTTDIRLFRLTRKLQGQKYSNRRVNNFRYIKSVERVKNQPMRCITVSDINGMYLCTENFIPTHNTWCLLAAQLRHKDVPGFSCITFRRTKEQIRNPEGLWDKSMALFLQFGLKPSEQQLEWTNKKIGLTLKFSHLQHEKDIYSHDGPEYCLECWDELQHFSKKMFFYLLTRNRSVCGIKPYILATCNPDPDSFLAELLEWWIDQKEKLEEDTWIDGELYTRGSKNPNWGFPIKERLGVIRYMFVSEEKYIWGDTKQEIVDKNPDLFQDIDSRTNVLDLIKSVTFVSGTIYDNQELLSKDPKYLANLISQDEAEKLRLLLGNWKIRAKDLCIFTGNAIDDFFDSRDNHVGTDGYVTVDAARFGDDLCTIWTWIGWKVVRLDVLSKSSQSEIVKIVEERRSEFNIPRSNVIIDQDGVGGGVVKLGKYIGFSGGDKAMEVAELKDKKGNAKAENYYNLKSQLSFRFAQKVNDGVASFDMHEGNVYVDGYHGTKIKIAGTTYDVKELIKQNFRAIRDKTKELGVEGKKKINDKMEQKRLNKGMSPDFYDGAFLRAFFDIKNSKIVVARPAQNTGGSLLDRIRIRKSA